jgi:hypothetical protein
MALRGKKGMREDKWLSAGLSTLLILAAVVFLLAAVALAFSSIDAALGTSSSVPMYQNGWSVATMVFVLAGNAIYLPGVLLGLAALGLAQSETTRERAAKLSRPLFIIGVAVLMIGVGEATCAVGTSYYGHLETLTWSAAQGALGHLGRWLFKAGTLAGLAYLCLRQVGSADSREANKLD